MFSHFVKHAIVGLLSSLSTLAVIAITNTFVTGRKQTRIEVLKDFSLYSGKETENKELRQNLAQLLSKAIQYKTISYDTALENSHTIDYQEFLALHSFLKKSFPDVFSNKNVEVKVINKYSLLIEWKGKLLNSKPLLFAAHMDVVPIENIEDWSIDDPFSGEIDEDGVVWGRGSIDNKHNVICQLMALDWLLKNGIEQLERTVFFAFGHDEEIGGTNGASAIADYLFKKFNIDAGSSNVYSGKEDERETFEFVFDEGPFLIKRLFPGMSDIPIGLVGCGEKGNVTLKISTKAFPPGHSSMPRTNGESNVAVLSKAIMRLESIPFPSNISFFQETLLSVFNDLPYYLRVIAANINIFGRFLVKFAEGSPPMIAGMRTTTAVTIVKCGHKINVVPGEAIAYVNHRIHPSILDNLGFDYKSFSLHPKQLETAVIQKVIEYDKKIIDDDRVEVTYDLHTFTPCSPITPAKSAQFDIIKGCVREVFNAPTATTLMIGNTDTRYYWPLSKHIYRFAPIVFESLEETKMFHGIDERVSSDNLLKLFQFYVSLLSRFA